MTARMALMGGWGYPATETPWGLPKLKTRLEVIGVEVLLTSWKARQDIYGFMHGFTGFRGFAGDSLGAGSAGQFPGDLEGEVDFAAGFQPSMDDARTFRGLQTIAKNIKRAHCIYDPLWIDTGGLGQAEWITAPGAKTILLVTKHRGAHPDDWGYSQDIVFNEIRGLLP
jgi:hypothetical protein